MATVTTNSKHYADIAASIRGKTGGTETYYPSQMAAAIDAIPTGGEPVSLKVLTEGADGRIDISAGEADIGLSGKKLIPHFTYNCLYNSASTTMEASVNCKAGDLVIAIIGAMPSGGKANLSVSDGWTTLFVSDDNSRNMIAAVAYKTATAETETITVTQSGSNRIYCSIFAVHDATAVSLYGDILYDWPSDATKTVPKPSGLAMVVGYSYYWNSTCAWNRTSGDLYGISDTTNQRLGVVIDESENESITFTPGSYVTGGKDVFFALTFDVESFYDKEEIEL